jgi:hypothetical protein
MKHSADIKIAVLIDADNAEAALIEPVLNEISKFGRVTIKRIYADWTNMAMKSWKDKLNTYAIRPIQKFAYTTGKNSSDGALIIDAMDILYSKHVGGICIVSSDSDYTGIAHRLREEGLFVMGIGKAHTPQAFIKACENFTYTEILLPKPTTTSTTTTTTQAPKKTTKPVSTSKPPSTQFPSKMPIDFELVGKAYDLAADQLTGQALASQLGTSFKKVDPTFDIRNYGFSTLKKFFEALKPQYEIIIHADKSTYSIKRNDE